MQPVSVDGPYPTPAGAVLADLSQSRVRRPNGYPSPNRIALASGLSDLESQPFARRWRTAQPPLAALHAVPTVRTGGVWPQSFHESTPNRRVVVRALVTDVDPCEGALLSRSRLAEHGSRSSVRDNLAVIAQAAGLVDSPVRRRYCRRSLRPEDSLPRVVATSGRPGHTRLLLPASAPADPPSLTR